MANSFGLTNKDGFEATVFGLNSYSGAFGGDLDSFFKPFTTNPSGRLKVPYYKTPLIPVNRGRANASGLNPFGSGTLGESIVSGPTPPLNLENTIQPTDVRTFGVKNPQTIVGWGYDIFGFPAPNFVTGWTNSGVYGNSQPTGLFKHSGVHGNSLMMSGWLAGPEDKRWDPHRGVWTSPQSVYSASITYVYVWSGSTLLGSGTSVTGSYFYPQLRYNALINDGLANYITITGVAPINNRPLTDTFKGLPLASGDICFLMHYPTSNGPRFGIALPGWEVPETEDCDADAALIPAAPPTDPTEVEASTEVLTGEVLFNALGNGGMASRHGGTGFDTYTPGQFLIGRNNNTLGKYLLIAGSGVSVTYDSLANATGTWTISIASGIATVNAGVLQNVTQISGLLTPLSVDQGGTGSSVKNFVDLQTAQSISGHKTFINPASFSIRDSGNPSIRYRNFENCGFTLATGVTSTGMFTILGGIPRQHIHGSGIVYYDHVRISPNIGVQSSLIVDAPQSLGYIDPSGNLILVSRNIQEWRNANGLLAALGSSGEFRAQALRVTGILNSGVAVNIHAPQGYSYNVVDIYNGTENVFSIKPTGSIVLRNTEILAGTTGSLTITLANATGTTRLQYAKSLTINTSGTTDALFCAESTNILRLNPTTTNDVIRGIVSGYDGQTIYIKNIGLGATGIRFSHEDFNNTNNANRINIPYQCNMLLRAGDTWQLYYDGVSSRWVVENGYDDYLMDNQYCYFLYDDFNSRNGNTDTTTANGGSFTTNSAQVSTGQFGVIRTNVATLSAVAALRHGGTLTINDTSIFDGYVKLDTLSNGVQNQDLFYGLLTAGATGILAANSMGFLYRHISHSGWMVRTAYNGIIASGAVNVQATTNWVHLKCVYNRFLNNSGVVNYYINNMLVAQHSGNAHLPVNDIYMQLFFMAQKQLGASNLTSCIDYWQYRKIGLRRRYE